MSQIRIDFVSYVTDEATAGICGNGTLTITGVDAATAKILPSNLCGTLTGQHLYLGVANTTTTVTLSITLLLPGAQVWRLLIRQFESGQTDYLAPRGCFQYFRQAEL